MRSLVLSIALLSGVAGLAQGRVNKDDAAVAYMGDSFACQT